MEFDVGLETLQSQNICCSRSCSLTLSLSHKQNTQGTIVEWTIPIGHAVKEGDVVALVETDKVTVDIKADYDGVVTQHFGAV
jgi:glycine cleavage system H lipoate-binding protein